MIGLFYQVGNLDLGGIWGGLGSSLAGGASTFFFGLGLIIVVSIIGFFVQRWYKNIAFYKTPVSLTIIHESGLEETRHDLRGGVFWNKGIRDFKIKIPKTRKPHVLGYIPDFSIANSKDNRLSFITSGDRTVWQQYSTKWITREEGEYGDGTKFEYDLVKTPVPRETKQLTVNSIKNWRDTIDKSKLTAFGIAIGGFIIMVIAHLISLFVQTKIRCGT